jgi:cytochrome c553
VTNHLRPHKTVAVVLAALIPLVGLGVRATAHTSKDCATGREHCEHNIHLHHHHYAELSKVPEKDRLRRNPFETDPEAKLAGRNLFEQHCAECHGADAQGGRRAPSLRAQEVQQATAGTLFWILTNGVVRRGMPVWSKLPEPQRWQIVTFVKSLTKAAAQSHDDGR